MVNFIVLALLCLIWFAMVSLQRTTRGGGVWDTDYSWFTVLWIAGFATHMLPLFEYRYPISVASGAFIVGSNLAFALGLVVATLLAKPFPARPDLSCVLISRLVLRAILALGAASLLLSSLDILRSSGIPLSARLDANAFAQARLANFAVSACSLGPLCSPVSILSALPYVGIALFFFAFGIGEKWARSWSPEALLTVAAVLVVAFDQIAVAAGRMAFLFLCILVTVTAAMGRKLRADTKGERLQRIPRPVLVGAVVGFTILSALVQQFRGNNADPRMVMAQVHGAFVAPAIEPLVQSNPFFGYYLLQTSYLTVPPHMLGVIVDLPKYQQPGPFWGQYNFQVLVRQVGRFLPDFDPDFWAKARAEIFIPHIRLGLGGGLGGGNAWATLLRDLMADFGQGGTLVFLYLFGLSAQALADSYRRQPTASKAALMAIFRMIALFSALLSLFFIGWVVVAILILTGLVCLAGVPHRSPRRAPSRAA